MPAGSSIVHVRASELQHLALDTRQGTLLVRGQVVICEVTLKRSHRFDKVVIASSSGIGQTTVGVQLDWHPRKKELLSACNASPVMHKRCCPSSTSPFLLVCAVSSTSLWSCWISLISLFSLATSSTSSWQQKDTTNWHNCQAKHDDLCGGFLQGQRGIHRLG